MAPPITVINHVFSLLLSCHSRGSKSISATKSISLAHEKSHDPRTRSPTARNERHVEAVASESTEKLLSTTWDKRQSSHEESHTVILSSEVRSKCSHLSIMQPKVRRSFFTSKTPDQEVHIDPLDEKAAQMEEEEDDKERSWNTGSKREATQPPPQREPGLRRLKTKIDAKLRKAKQ